MSNPLPPSAPTPEPSFEPRFPNKRNTTRTIAIAAAAFVGAFVAMFIWSAGAAIWKRMEQQRHADELIREYDITPKELDEAKKDWRAP